MNADSGLQDKDNAQDKGGPQNGIMILQGIRVIDLTVFVAGPTVTGWLGDLGAEVIKVEARGSGDTLRGQTHFMGVPTTLAMGKNAPFEHHNRNKKSITLDLRKPQGKEIIYHLIEKSDVFVSNLLPIKLHEFGVDYPKLFQINPKIIYATNTIFGPKGPDANKPGFDILGQARSGVMASCGEADGPPAYGPCGMLDNVSAVTLYCGILGALLARERFGIGQEVTVSQLGSAVTTALVSLLVLQLTTGNNIGRWQRQKARNPLANWYQCKDGRWIALTSHLANKFWPTLCKAWGVPELESDPRFSDMEKRIEHNEELIRLLDDIFSIKTAAEWYTIFDEAGTIAFSVVNELGDLVSDPQVIANDYIITWDHPELGPLKWPAHPISFSKTPGVIRTPAPEFGAHTEEVLIDLCNYSWEDITKLKDDEVI